MHPHGRILGFTTISSRWLLNFTQAEWTLFQSIYFSENLVALEI
jgi:hypothetical protein